MKKFNRTFLIVLDSVGIASSNSPIPTESNTIKNALLNFFILVPYNFFIVHNFYY